MTTPLSTPRGRRIRSCGRYEGEITTVASVSASGRRVIEADYPPPDWRARALMSLRMACNWAPAITGGVLGGGAASVICHG